MAVKCGGRIALVNVLLVLCCLSSLAVANDRPKKVKVVKKLVDRFTLTCPIVRVHVQPTQPTSLASPDVLRHTLAYTGFKDAEPSAGNSGTTASLADPTKLPYVDHRQHFFSCWDARATYAILGTAGGDAAEFLLALNAVEKTRPLSQAFSEAQVYSYLQEWVSTRKFFYMHSDKEHVKKWADASGVPDPLHPPSEAARQEVIRLAPVFIGCDHFQNIIKYETEYQTRHALTEALIRSVVRLLTDITDPLHERIQFVILDGHVHDEQALLAIHSPSGVVDQADEIPGCFWKAPLIVPHVPASSGMKSAMVHHPRAIFEHRSQLAEFFEDAERQDANWRDKLFVKMNEIGSQQALLTKQKTTKAPTYQVRFDTNAHYDEMKYPNPTFD